MQYQYQRRPFARGGEKRVHLATCVDNGLTVVVKFPIPPYTSAALARFKQEVVRALQARQAAGSGVAEILDYNLDVVPPFYIEEYCPEGTLAQKMKATFLAGQTFSLGDALAHTRQVLVVLHKLHKGNQIHRDLKPQNIMIKAGMLLLNDMGLGRTLDRSSALQTRLFKGTRGYAAPEQEYGGAIDHRADLYATGVMLHEMLTGHRGAWNSITYNQHPTVRAMLCKLLALHRDQRYANAMEVIAAVDDLQAHRPAYF